MLETAFRSQICEVEFGYTTFRQHVILQSLIGLSYIHLKSKPNDRK